MPISRNLRELTAAAALAAAFFAAGVLLPTFGPLLGFFACGPLIWLTLRRGGLAGALGGMVAAAALLPVIPPPATLFFIIEHALPGWYLGRRLAGGKGIVASSVQTTAFIAAVLFVVSFLWLGGGTRDPQSFFDEQLRSGLREMEGGNAGSPAPPFPPEVQSLLGVVRRVFPALALIGLFLECSVNSLMVLRVLARSLPPAAPEPVLTTFALPEWLIWVLIPALACVWWPQSAVATVALNLVLPLLFGYLLQGLSVGLSLMQRLRLSRFGLTLLVLALLFQPYLLAVPLLLGLLDFRFDFRRRWAPRPPAPG